MAWHDVDGNIFPNEEAAREHALENMTTSDYVAFCPLTMSQILEKLWTYYPALWAVLAGAAFEDELFDTEEAYFQDHYWEDEDEDEDEDDDYEPYSNYSYNEVQEEYERNAGGL